MTDSSRPRASRTTWLGFSARADYGMRALLELADAHEEDPARRLTSEQIATAQGLPAKYLEGVLAGLATAGILTSSRGVGGGYRLADPPEAISLWTVVTALEGAVPSVRGRPVDELQYSGSAAHLADLWQGVSAALKETLGSRSLRDLMTAEEAR